MRKQASNHPNSVNRPLSRKCTVCQLRKTLRGRSGVWTWRFLLLCTTEAVVLALSSADKPLALELLLCYPFWMSVVVVILHWNIILCQMMWKMDRLLVVVAVAVQFLHYLESFGASSWYDFWQISYLHIFRDLRDSLLEGIFVWCVCVTKKLLCMVPLHIVVFKIFLFECPAPPHLPGRGLKVEGERPRFA